jgi:hypothetical protein
MTQTNRGEKYLSKAELKDGAYYFGGHRNGDTCRWNAEDSKFYYWRDKFGSRFVETIRHPEDDDGFALFIPLKEIDYGTEEIPFDGPLVFK